MTPDDKKASKADSGIKEDLPEIKTGFMGLQDSETEGRLPEIGPRSLLKTTEWGLLTVVSLLSSFAFPPYFLTVMTLAFLNAGGLLWVTHLSEKGRARLKEFERDFRVGHSYEDQGKWVEAVGVYLTLIPRYEDVSQLVMLCEKRVQLIKTRHSEYFPKNPKPVKKKTAKSKAKKKKRS